MHATIGGRPLALVALLLVGRASASGQPAQAPPVAGHWEGAIDLPGMEPGGVRVISEGGIAEMHTPRWSSPSPLKIRDGAAGLMATFHGIPMRLEHRHYETFRAAPDDPALAEMKLFEWVSAMAEESCVRKSK